MNRRTLLGAGAGLVGGAWAGRTTAGEPSAPTASRSLQVRLDRLRSEVGIPALGGAIVTAEGLAWIGATGARRAGHEVAVTIDDRWHLGSNTKAMTAALYARLVEQGRTRWGARLADLFPDLPVDSAWNEIHIEHLFGHRAGILDARFMPAWMIRAWTGDDLAALRTGLAQTVLSSPPPGPVGTFSYSNAGFIIAGAALERITGESWEASMRREVFEPLGMDSAGFGGPLGDNAWGHQGSAMRPMDPSAVGSDNPPALGPAGTVHATMADYARFLRVFLTQGSGWLSADSLRHLTQPLTGEGQAYALGWGVVSGPGWTGGGPALAHDGSNTLWLARGVVAPSRSVGLICVANASDPAQPAIDGLTQALIERFPV
ncbi:MAG: beta-lactamase family protein [Caulobacterales bacterium]|nr:beta-lactamase family protein [Caulobacterales bacterium]